MLIMEFLQLIYFCSAAETENFAKTAKIFGVPSTGVSQSVRRLEKELGVSLFDRVSNGIKLNERGRLFYSNAKASLDMLDDAKKKVCEEEVVVGHINLLVVTNRLFVVRVMTEFCKIHQNITFNIDYENKGHTDDYDLIITDNLRYDESQARYSLISDEIVLALPKKHPLAEKEVIETKDLKDEKLICYSYDTGLYSLTRRICKQADFNPNVAARIDDPYCLAKCVESGMGIALIPEFAYKGLFSDNVCIRHFTNVRRGTIIVHKKTKYMSKPTKLFLDMLFEKIKER